MNEIKNAKIESTFLGYEDHGIFTCFIHLDYGGTSQQFGGYSIGVKFLIAVLKTLEVESWENLKGQHIRVEATHDKVHKIGHLLKDKWFDPKELNRFIT